MLNNAKQADSVQARAAKLVVCPRWWVPERLYSTGPHRAGSVERVACGVLEGALELLEEEDHVLIEAVRRWRLGTRVDQDHQLGEIRRHIPAAHIAVTQDCGREAEAAATGRKEQICVEDG